MSFSYGDLFPFFAVVHILSLLNLSTSFNTNSSASMSSWSLAAATWYGGRNGYGSDGGACGYGVSVKKPPFLSMIVAGSSSLFKSGKGCSACYQVRCTENAACSGSPVTVVIADKTDEYTGGPLIAQPLIHFDLSGTAFGSMAFPGQADRLRNTGILRIEFVRTECNYPGIDVTFHVGTGSNSEYFAVLIEYDGGDGTLAAVDLKQGGSPTGAWLPMRQSWGAVWRLDADSELRAPFSLRLTSGSGKTLVARNVIPTGWKPHATYRSLVNFNS